MSFATRPPTSKPEPTKFLKRGEGPKTQKFYGKYAMYPANEQQIDRNLPDVQPDYGEVYPNKTEKSFQYTNSNKTKGGRRRRLKQTKRKRRKQTKRLR
jgi:hypothetical protein